MGERREVTTKSTKSTKNGIELVLQHPLPVEYIRMRLDCGCGMGLFAVLSYQHLWAAHSRSPPTPLPRGGRGEDEEA